MIKRKVGICPKCPDGSAPTILIAGQCQNHYWFEKNNKQKKKSEPDPTPVGPWFDYHNSSCVWVCENCGAILNPFTPKVASSCQAHIIPKKLFPSVKNVLENHLVLGGLHQPCTCHGQYDSSWLNATKMPVFEKAKQRFIKFAHLIHPSEYKNLPEELLTLM